MQRELPHRDHGGSSFDLVFRSDSLRAQDPAFKQALLAAVAPLRADPRVTGVTTPYDQADAAQASYASRDGHAALVSVSVRDAFGPARAYYSQLRAKVRSDHLQVQ